MEFSENTEIDTAQFWTDGLYFDVKDRDKALNCVVKLLEEGINELTCGDNDD